MKSVKVVQSGVTYWQVEGTYRHFHRDEIDSETGLSLPAWIDTWGYKSWFINNIRHRIDGPAVEYNGGGIKTQYWINGKHITQLDGKYIYGKSKLATALLLS